MLKKDLHIFLIFLQTMKMEVIILQGQLSQKERMLLEDLKKEEDLCVVKYQNYAQQTQDAQLGQLFNKIAGDEQRHYDTVNQLLQSGGVGLSGIPGKHGSQQQGQGGNQGGGGQGGQGGQGGGSSDKHMLHDMLSTEKYVSSAYDTSVFESTQSSVRKALQQIQQDEQDHGEQLYQYMSSHGMYQVQ
jgi:spore coat protein CotF